MRVFGRFTDGNLLFLWLFFHTQGKHTFANPEITEMLHKKFRGCLVGALIGDCVGFPYEGERVVNKDQLQRYFNKLEGPPFKSPVYKYTDDTTMTRQVALSLIENQGFNATDMASRFVKEYYNNPYRGYGERVIEVFLKLNSQNLTDIWKPAREQFNGTGSYGNGGAMRIAPVALFYYNDYNQMIENATKITEITHTHPLGVTGALVQAAAVHEALHLDSSKPLNVNAFLKTLIGKISNVEKKAKRVVPEKVTYTEQLQVVESLLEKDINAEYVVEKLGNSVSAIYSVPTAIYCFLRSQKPMPDIESENPFRKAIQFAVSLGGDTDTIASMAGAISGAFHGIDVINQNLQSMCEDTKNLDDIAVKLYNTVCGNDTGSQDEQTKKCIQRSPTSPKRQKLGNQKT